MLRLSDAYFIREEHPALELEAVMLNINAGNNPELLKACKSLGEYAEYVAKVRRYAKDMALAEAVERAITECIQEGILADFLERNRAEVKKVSLYEYDAEKHMQQVRGRSKRRWADGTFAGIDRKETGKGVCLFRRLRRLWRKSQDTIRNLITP